MLKLTLIRMLSPKFYKCVKLVGFQNKRDKTPLLKECSQIVQKVIIEILFLILNENLLKLDIQSKTKCVIKSNVLTFGIAPMKDCCVCKRMLG